MRQYLEQRLYEPIQESEDLKVYQVGDLESLSASALYIGSRPLKIGSGPLKIGSRPLTIRPARNTEYFNILNTSSQTIGLTHHPVGLGKLKIFDHESKTEYGVSITDILNKQLKDWKIDKK